MTDNVVSIEARLAAVPPLDVKDRDWLGCDHKATVVDDVLRTVSCRTCHERLDPIEVLIRLAREWRSWRWQWDQLQKANAEYRDNRKASWERARDRHLGAHPDHERRDWITLGDGQTVPRGLEGNGMTPPRDCRQCYSLAVRMDHRWVVRRGPEPPSGRLGSQASEQDRDAADVLGEVVG